MLQYTTISKLIICTKHQL